MRADNEQGNRATYAKHLAEKRARQGVTFEEAYDKMYERNYFGMSMVEQGDADAFVTGLYTKYSNTIKVAKEVIGIRKDYNTFATMHILNTKKGVFYLADTLINRHPDQNVLYDVARLAAHTVKFFNNDPVIAMISYSNFGTDEIGSPVKFIRQWRRCSRIILICLLMVRCRLTSHSTVSFVMTSIPSHALKARTSTRLSSRT